MFLFLVILIDALEVDTVNGLLLWTLAVTQPLSLAQPTLGERSDTGTMNGNRAYPSSAEEVFWAWRTAHLASPPA